MLNILLCMILYFIILQCFTDYMKTNSVTNTFEKERDNNITKQTIINELTNILGSRHYIILFNLE